MKSKGNFALAKYTYHLKMFKYFKTNCHLSYYLTVCTSGAKYINTTVNNLSFYNSVFFSFYNEN